MDSLILGINIVFPVFFVMGLGYLCRLKGFIDENFVDKSTWLVYFLALPLKLFYDIKNAEIDSLDKTYLFYILFGILLITFISLLIGKTMIKNDGKKLSAFVHSSFRSNFVYVGLPIIDMIYKGSQSMEDLLVVIIFGLTFYNIVAVILFSYYGKEDSKRISPLKIFLDIVKNPMIIGIVLGAVFNYFKLPLYSGIEKSIEIVGSLSTPLSLILVGASLEFSTIKDDRDLVVVGGLIKTILAPLVMIPLGVFLKLSTMQLGIAYVFWAAPVAITSFIFTKQMKSDYKLAIKILSFSYLLSIITFPIGIALMQAFNLLY